jgi:hypothetical protein
MMKYVLTATALILGSLTQSVNCAADHTFIDVVPLTANADWDVAPDGSGFVVTSRDGMPADLLVSIASPSGVTIANVTVSNDGSWIDAVGDSGYQPAAPLVLERGSQVAYVMALTNACNANATTSSYSSGSWLDDYSNWFNSTFGSGWSEAAGGVIHDGLTTVIDESTLANTSDGAILIGTSIASVGIVAGGEYVLGVGTLGGTATTATVATGGTVATGAGTLTTVSTTAGTVHVSTVGGVATVEVGFVEAITPNLVRTVTKVALEQGATSVVVNTGPVVNIDLAISLGPASETGATVLSGEVVLVEGGLAPIFEIFISLL